MFFYGDLKRQVGIFGLNVYYLVSISSLIVALTKSGICHLINILICSSTTSELNVAAAPNKRLLLFKTSACLNFNWGLLTHLQKSKLTDLNECSCWTVGLLQWRGRKKIGGFSVLYVCSQLLFCTWGTQFPLLAFTSVFPTELLCLNCCMLLASQLLFWDSYSRVKVLSFMDLNAKESFICACLETQITTILHKYSTSLRIHLITSVSKLKPHSLFTCRLTHCHTATYWPTIKQTHIHLKKCLWSRQAQDSQPSMWSFL